MPDTEHSNELDPKIAAAVERAVASLRSEFDDKIAAARRELGLDAKEAADEPAAAATAPATPPAVSETVEELKQALGRIDRADSQAAVLTALIEGARRFASRSALFLVRPQVLEWWDGQGFERASRSLPELEVERADGSAWARLAAGEGTVTLGPEECGAVCDPLDVDRPLVGAILPFVLGDQVAAGLYCDRVEGESSLELSALQILTFTAAQTLETLPLRKRERTVTLVLAGAASAPPAAAAPDREADAPAESRPPEDETREAPTVPEPESPPADDVAEKTAPEAAADSSGLSAAEAAFELEEAPTPDSPRVEAEAESRAAAESAELWGPPDEPASPEAPPASARETSVADVVTEELPELPDLPDPADRPGPGLYTPGLETTEILPVAPAEGTPETQSGAPSPPVEEGTRPGVAAPSPPTGETESEAPTEPSRATPEPAPEPAADREPERDPSTPSTQVAPPDDLEGPGWAFSGSDLSTQVGESELQEEAQRLARLLCTEIKLYNEEQVEEGRRKGDLYERLQEDIERSRRIYDDRIDSKVRAERDFFREALVRILAGGDESLIKA